MSEQTVVPNHVGIIMDGNRRWARERGLQPMQGHEEGVETLKKIVRYAFDNGINYMSTFVFSTENWKRSKTEVSFLMDLILRLFQKELDEFNKEGHRIVILGSKERVSKKILGVIEETERRTARATGGTLALCFNYSSEQELSDAFTACKQAAIAVSADVAWRDYLYHPEVPDIDLIIRTSGEQRLSGFMLPRASYAELAFVETHWPAFTVEDFQSVLTDYADRQRRFGA